jgi:hypothetical protein
MAPGNSPKEELTMTIGVIVLSGLGWLAAGRPSPTLDT